MTFCSVDNSGQRDYILKKHRKRGNRERQRDWVRGGVGVSSEALQVLQSWVNWFGLVLILITDQSWSCSLPGQQLTEYLAWASSCQWINNLHCWVSKSRRDEDSSSVGSCFNSICHSNRGTTSHHCPHVRIFKITTNPSGICGSWWNTAEVYSRCVHSSQNTVAVLMSELFNL